MSTFTGSSLPGLLFFVLVGAAFSISSTSTCIWHWESNSLIVNCSNRDFTAYPVIKQGIPIEHLDLSHNRIEVFPSTYANITALTYLDLADNEIQEIHEDALIGFNSLRVLCLAYNGIHSWSDISPNTAFQHARSLQRLSLAGNRLRRFSDVAGAPLLISDTLTELDLSNCGITQVDNVLSGMPNLEALCLSDNNLKVLTSLPSKSLRSLDASNCSLKSINTSFIASVPNLQVLNLSWNPLVTLGNQPNDIVRWESLRQIDMSFCYMSSLGLSGMPNLRVATLQGNKFVEITGTMFANNSALEVLDLSRSHIQHLDIAAFHDLGSLTNLDLSHNEIAKLNVNQFRYNPALESLDLSHNKFIKLSAFVSPVLRSVNLSWCGIFDIDPNIFVGLWALVSLDLSHNPIADIPPNMVSKTLKQLNLSNCRLATIRNTTFNGFPVLTSLNLSGNRFTSAFRTAYFKSNVLLSEIWLGGNEWYCECHNSTFLAFFEYLTDDPQKIKDKDNLKCFNPTEHYGKTWELTCLSDRSLEIWTTILFLMLVFFVLACYGILIVISCCRKIIRRKIARRNNEELEENEEELAEIYRQHREYLNQGVHEDSPELSEIMLPSYEDALRMPKPDRTSQSMMNLSTNYRPIPRTKLNEKSNEEGVVLDNQPFRSQEMILNRDKERTEYITTCRRTSVTDYIPPRRRCFTIDDRSIAPRHMVPQNLSVTTDRMEIPEYSRDLNWKFEQPDVPDSLNLESTLPGRIPE